VRNVEAYEALRAAAAASFARDRDDAARVENVQLRQALARAHAQVSAAEQAAGVRASHDAASRGRQSDAQAELCDLHRMLAVERAKTEAALAREADEAARGAEVKLECAALRAEAAAERDLRVQASDALAAARGGAR
jgi:hypothetical protein